MAHRHRQRGVGAGLRRQPVVGELHVVGVVGRDDDDLLAAVARLGHEVRVRRARDRQVRAPHDQVARVPPVGRLRARRSGRRTSAARRAAGPRTSRRTSSCEPPISDRKRLPAANDTGDIAGIGVKPPTRSGPCSRIACTVAAAISSLASSHVAADEPAAAALAAVAAVGRDLGERGDRVGAGCAARRASARAGCRACTGTCSRTGEYVYQENDAPRGQPRGSWSGRSGSVRG